jgi:hypothetical protein
MGGGPAGGGGGPSWASTGSAKAMLMTRLARRTGFAIIAISRRSRAELCGRGRKRFRNVPLAASSAGAQREAALDRHPREARE